MKLSQNTAAALTDLKESIESLKSLKTAESVATPPPLPPNPPQNIPAASAAHQVSVKVAEVVVAGGESTPVVATAAVVSPVVVPASSSPNIVSEANLSVKDIVSAFSNGTLDTVDHKLNKSVNQVNPLNTENTVVGGVGGGENKKNMPPGEFRIITSETKCKTTFQRSAKGPISICECSPDGKVIIVENTSKNKDISLSKWEIKRRVDGNEEITYTFPDGLVLKPSKIVRVWSRNVMPTDLLPSDLINEDIETWGVGEYVITIILNEAGNEKATHLQKTVFNQIGA